MELPPPFAFSAQTPRVGNYQLLRELALGSSFRIDLAIAPGVAKAPAVAIKRLRHDSQSGRERLLREARVGAGLRAPNLLRVVEARGFTGSEGPFVALEYVRGASLHKLLAHARPSDLRHALAVILGALHGLDALHSWSDEQGTPGYLVHQAPTARHMLVGVDGISRLIDLSHLHGRLLGEDPGSEGLVTAELAPEQVQGRELDPRCDVFIAGVTLRNVIARCAPLERAKFAPLDEVWQRATAPRRSDRFWCAQELGFALQRAAAELELVSTAAELGTWVRARTAGDPARPRNALSRTGNVPASSRTDQMRLTGSRPALLPARSAEDEFAVCRPSLVDAPMLEPAPIPPPLPAGERCSSVWYSIEADETDDDVVRAIAAAQPLRRRPKPWSVLRSLASGAGLGALVLCGFVAMGASQRDDEPQANRGSFALPVVRAAAPAAPVPTVTAMVTPKAPPKAASVPYAAPVLDVLPDRELQPQAPRPKLKAARGKNARAKAPRFSLYGVPQNPF